MIPWLTLYKKSMIPDIFILPYESETGGGWSTLLNAIQDEELDGRVLHSDTKISFDDQVDTYRAYLGDMAASAIETASKVTNFRFISWNDFHEKVVLFANEIAKRVLSLPSRHLLAFVISSLSTIKSDTWLFLLIAKQLQKHPKWTHIAKNIILFKRTKHEPKTPPHKLIKGTKLHIVATDDMVYSGQQLGVMTYYLTQLGINYPDIIESITIRPIFSSQKGIQYVRSNIRDALKNNKNIEKSQKKQNQSGVRPIVRPFKAPIERTAEADMSNVLKKLVDADVGVCITIDRPDGRATYAMSMLSSMGLVSYIQLRNKKYFNTYSYDTMVIVSDKPDYMIVALLEGIDVIFEHKLADSLSLPTSALMHGRTVRSVMAKTCMSAVCDGTIPRGATVHVDKFKNILNKVSNIHVPYHDPIFVMNDWHPSKTAELVSVRKHKTLKDMPMHLPLLLPANACDDDTAKHNKNVNKNWSVNLEFNRSSKCENPPYKKNILDKIKKLPAVSDVRDFYK
jgi:hypothetical protein